MLNLLDTGEKKQQYVLHLIRYLILQNRSKENEAKIIFDIKKISQSNTIKKQIQINKKQIQINKKIMSQNLKFINFIVHDLHGIV